MSNRIVFVTGRGIQGVIEAIRNGYTIIISISSTEEPRNGLIIMTSDVISETTTLNSRFTIRGYYTTFKEFSFEKLTPDGVLALLKSSFPTDTLTLEFDPPPDGTDEPEQQIRVINDVGAVL